MGLELRTISDGDKAAIRRELKAMPMRDVVATHRRLHQWAAQGNVLSGFTKEDMEWLHGAVEAELRRRAEEAGRKPPEPTPLEWGRSEAGPEEEDDERHLPATVKKIIAKAKKKKKSSIIDGGREMERRTFPIRELRVVEGEEGKPPRITGYAAVFNERSVDLGGFVEEIEPGAFKKTLSEGDVRSLWNHNPDYVLGRTKSGTLVLEEDEFGLRFEASPPDTQWARDAMVTMRRGDVDQASFGFDAIRDNWRQDGELVVRRLVEVALYDVSPVTFPAYPQTSAEVREKVRLLRAKGRTPEDTTSAPGQGPHPEGDGGEGGRARARLGILRRKLDLEEERFRHLEV